MSRSPDLTPDFRSGYGLLVALIRLYLAVAHRDDAVRIGGNVRFMRHQNDREAAIPIERHQGFHDVVRCARIKIAGRLVGQQHGWRVDQRPRDRDALLLAAGELARRVALAVRQVRDSCSDSRARGARSAPDKWEAA